jgi:protein-S-isoprenylcysteine O-methyltransferase Ste14
LGALLAIYGVATMSNPTAYTRSLAVGVNLWWGLVMLAFGAAMLAFGLRAMKAQRAHPSPESRAGVATEEREHRLGLEREEGLGDSTR